MSHKHKRLTRITQKAQAPANAEVLKLKFVIDVGLDKMKMVQNENLFSDTCHLPVNIMLPSQVQTR